MEILKIYAQLIRIVEQVKGIGGSWEVCILKILLSFNWSLFRFHKSNPRRRALPNREKPNVRASEVGSRIQKRGVVYARRHLLRGTLICFHLLSRHDIHYCCLCVMIFLKVFTNFSLWVSIESQFFSIFRNFTLNLCKCFVFFSVNKVNHGQKWSFAPIRL